MDKPKNWDRSTCVNHVVKLATYTMLAKCDDLLIRVEMSTCEETKLRLLKEISEIQTAVEVMQRRDGCWA